MLKPATLNRSAPRVLHIVESLNRGAIENWLVRMLRHASQGSVEVDWTFYCTLGREGALDGEVVTLGARVVQSPVSIGDKIAFVSALRAELQNGKYDVLHCHHDLVSAVYLFASAGMSIRRRIVHVHNADQIVPTPNRFKQLFYREPMRHLCLAMADRVVGISNHVLDTFLAGRPRRPGRDVVHYYGLDPAPFENTAYDCGNFRCELGLPADALILLFAGRVVPEKNPVFAVEVLRELRCLEPRAVLVIAGAGGEERRVITRAHALGVEHSTRLIGWRSDLPKIMNCSNWFILPRPEHPLEGFGLAVLEAQLAGLPMLLSQGIADDPLLPTANFFRLPLSAGPRAWAQAAVQLSRSPLSSRSNARAALAKSPFAMKIAFSDLMLLHDMDKAGILRPIPYT